jgi:cytochrome c oxidase subunit 2
MATEGPVATQEGRANAVRAERAKVGQLVAIGLTAAVLGIALGLIIDWFPVAASGEAKDIDTLWDVLIIASVPVFVLVQTVVLYSVWKFRMRPGEELVDGPPIHGNTRLEIVWTAIPAILLVGLCSYAYIVLHDIENAAAKATMNVRVVGEQFTWTFHYPGESGGKELVTNELYLPVDTEVKFTVQSKDVIHDFWVPAFREKIDAGRRLRRRLRGAVRARALGDAPDGARPAQGRVRLLAGRAAVEGGGVTDGYIDGKKDVD